MKHTKYLVQYFDTGKDPEIYPHRENDFGRWTDSNSEYSTYEEAEEEFDENVSHASNEMFRIIERTIIVETREYTLNKHIPVLEDGNQKTNS